MATAAVAFRCVHLISNFNELPNLVVTWTYMHISPLRPTYVSDVYTHTHTCGQEIGLLLLLLTTISCYRRIGGRGSSGFCVLVNAILVVLQLDLPTQRRIRRLHLIYFIRPTHCTAHTTTSAC